MSISRKYGRTYHYPFSPGTTSDDRINYRYWDDLSNVNQLVHTEKLDGENTCLNQYGVFSRSHAAPTRHPWAQYLLPKWNMIRHDLGDLEIFGESLYAVHSIRYHELEHHYYVFGIRCLDTWLSWEEVEFYAALLDFPTVPILGTDFPKTELEFELEVRCLTGVSSCFLSTDTVTEEPCKMEGLVTRNSDEFSVNSAHQNVFKFVRKNHVKTNEHWTRTWKRAPLKWERCGD